MQSPKYSQHLQKSPKKLLMILLMKSHDSSFTKITYGKILLPVQVLIEVPYCLAQCLLYSVITYSMMSLQWTALKFFYYTFVLFFTLLYFTFYGMMAVAITPNHQVAAILAAGFYSIFNLFSGFMIFKPVSMHFTHQYFFHCF